jgi:hypothetical protein
MIRFTWTQTWYTRKKSKSILLHENHIKEKHAIKLISINKAAMRGMYVGTSRRSPHRPRASRARFNFHQFGSTQTRTLLEHAAMKTHKKGSTTSTGTSMIPQRSHRRQRGGASRRPGRDVGLDRLESAGSRRALPREGCWGSSAQSPASERRRFPPSWTWCGPWHVGERRK